MTVQSTPMWVQAGSHNAEDMRRMVGALVGNRGGVVRSSDMAVTQKSGTTNMSVDVAGGQLFLPGTESSYQGFYYCENRGTTNVAVSASSPTNGRYDIVVARIRDAAYSTGPSSTFALEVVAGTPSATPSEPSLPANCFALARVYVGPAVTSITNANILDLRLNRTVKSRAAALGGVIAADSSSNLPTTNVDYGTLGFVYATGGQALYYWSGSTWVALATPPTAWTSPALSNGWTNFAGYMPSAYRKIGDVVYLRGTLGKSTTPTPGETILTLPAGYRPPYASFYTAQGGDQVAYRLDLATDGTLRFAPSIAGPPTFLALNAISFSTV